MAAPACGCERRARPRDERAPVRFVPAAEALTIARRNLRMDEADDKGQCGEGKPQDPAEQRGPYEVAVVLVQEFNGPACTRSAAHTILLKAFKALKDGKRRVAAFFPAKLIRRNRPYVYGFRYDHPTSNSPLEAEDWRPWWEEDHFTVWLPSVEAALGADPVDPRQETGEPWTAENTEWQLDELLSALSDPTINPFATLKAAAHSPLHQEVHDPGDLPAHAVLTEPAPAGQATPTPRRKNPGRPAIPIDLIGPKLREMDANNELPRDNAKLTAERLSAWLADKHPDRVAKPNGIRNNEEFKTIYDELTTVER
jgi:hypothetical protein